MKSDEIKKAALKYFTIHGYEGTSLSQIAEDVGIKKQSIYSHFKGKDDLFLSVLKDAKEMELSFYVEYFNIMKKSDPEKMLYGFLEEMIKMFQEVESLKFWLRMGFFPPTHLYNEIQKETDDLQVQQEALMENIFGTWISVGVLNSVDARTLTLAYSGVIVAIMVELVYADNPDRVAEKLAASWTIFWRGISK
ncbi:TetR/AcrR family transcriptional regulator [Peribacillus butanolivorans]|uniref:TetR family transcriptional regulator n=1 Tax=Peribacillus butanolivorans TaxID=421767 RepID=A0AAX0RSH6_9BACI|nr:TetR/AcrR family transcriptional regulator [Peribacillus butanolivorans]AXN38469.1 TetR/AcrR family transcriptional regulator [Peribacillus butanolivorans]PEJ35662.1 TetR family transcriptional regulator [Peribacillus butanolivorans]QNU03062.1 TetR/AcrR family transcriptional regulator [Peribacillus butanolivorans]